jgi:hypothetical protein
MEGRIGAWERGIDTPSATYIPTLARVLGVEPLALFDIDPGRAVFHGVAHGSGSDVAGAIGGNRNLLYIASLVDGADLHLICWLSISPVA